MRHIELISELNEASNLLSSAIDRYMQACAAILNYCEIGSSSARALLDCAMVEIPKVSVYDEKVQRAKATIWRTRNQSPNLAPINTLPFEIMSYIFWLSWDCSLSVEHRPNPFYPSVLLRVCSRWRQITLGSHKLWSHIDVHTNWAPNLSLKRAKLFATQSAQLPLDLHIKTGLLSSKHHKRLTDFYRSVAPRVQSFEIHHGDDSDPFHDDHQTWLDTLLSGVTAGTLSRVCIKSYGLQAVPVFLCTQDSAPTGHRNVRVSVTEQHLEDILFPVTRLQLKGIYPTWSSRAYCGLVELSLEALRGSEITLKDSELATILQASPGLRVFHFGLGIEREGSVLPPVELNDLQSLQITSYSHSAQKSVLRMVHPGQAPLELTIRVSDDVRFVFPSQTWDELVDFASRSNITLLHIEQRDLYKEDSFDPLTLFPLMPQLEALVLDGFSIGQQCADLLEGYSDLSHLATLLGYEEPPALHQQLRLLRLIRCKIYWSDFRHASEIHPTAKLVLDRCEVDFHPSQNPDLESALKCITPFVEHHEIRVTRVASRRGY
ncbi:hypothetical protein ACGC1H_002513 [Rhizoctonia solani]|uniref:F-box domain-containing protein n=1 Tax=Rhizoctonia solani TaxID=456999 RepID=A0A8H3GC92_9AGAM|nr:unnamed protein product [Rhizoctonia solani]